VTATISALAASPIMGSAANASSKVWRIRAAGISVVAASRAK
jgi:hypothetical protein